MKKLLLILLFILLGLLIIYIVRFYMPVDKTEGIPAGVSEVVNVNVRQLEQRVINGIISHPFSFFAGESDSEEGTSSIDDFAHEEKGEHEIKVKFTEVFKIPKSFSFYKMTDGIRAWVSTYLSIKEETLLVQELERRAYTLNDNYQNETYCSKSICLEVTQGKARFIWNNYPSDSKISGVGLVSGNIGAVLKRSEHDITYVNDLGEFAYVDFSDGSVELSGNIDFSFLDVAGIGLQEKGIMQLVAGIDVDLLATKLGNKMVAQFEEFTKLKLDSIENYWLGNVLFDLKDYYQRSDTIKTYEYDDDFNKIEKESISTTSDPRFHSFFLTNNDIMPYLLSQKAVVVDQKDTILAIMPLARTIASSNNTGISFSNYSSSHNIAPFGNKLSFYWDVEAYQDQTQGQKDHMGQEFDQIKEINLDISRDNEIKMKIHMKEEGSSILNIIKSLE